MESWRDLGIIHCNSVWPSSLKLFVFGKGCFSVVPDITNLPCPSMWKSFNCNTFLFGGLTALCLVFCWHTVIHEVLQMLIYTLIFNLFKAFIGEVFQRILFRCRSIYHVNLFSRIALRKGLERGWFSYTDMMILSHDLKLMNWNHLTLELSKVCQGSIYTTSVCFRVGIASRLYGSYGIRSSGVLVRLYSGNCLGL